MIDLDARLSKFLLDTNNVQGKAVDPYGQFESFMNIICDMSTEEALWYTLLFSVFDSVNTGKEFYDLLSWEEFLCTSKSELHKLISKFFDDKRYIGGHRKYFLCMPREKRTNELLEILISYRNIVLAYDSHSAFYGLDDEGITFGDIYDRLGNVYGFHTRLIRFDHIERISKAFGTYLVPERMMIEGTSGPQDGLLYLMSGIDYGKLDRECKSDFREYICCSEFRSELNAQVGCTVVGDCAMSFEDVVVAMEIWLINEICKRLNVQKSAVVFELESALCNWQKENYRALLHINTTHR